MRAPTLGRHGVVKNILVTLVIDSSILLPLWLLIIILVIIIIIIIIYALQRLRFS